MVRRDKCPDCGAPLIYDEETGKYMCEYCGYGKIVRKKKEEPAPEAAESAGELSADGKAPEEVRTGSRPLTWKRIAWVYVFAFIIIMIVGWIRGCRTEEASEGGKSAAGESGTEASEPKKGSCITRIDELIVGRTFFEDLGEEAVKCLGEYAGQAKGPVLSDHKLAAVRLYGDDERNLLFYVYRAEFTADDGSTDVSYPVMAFEQVRVENGGTDSEKLAWERPADDYVNTNGSYERSKTYDYPIGYIPGCGDPESAVRLMDERAAMEGLKLSDSADLSDR